MSFPKLLRAISPSMLSLGGTEHPKLSSTQLPILKLWIYGRLDVYLQSYWAANQSSLELIKQIRLL